MSQREKSKAISKLDSSIESHYLNVICNVDPMSEEFDRAAEGLENYYQKRIKEIGDA